jgi:hypothetical protein
MLRISGIRKVFSNCENSFDAGKGEDPALSVAGNFGVFAGFETPTGRVRVNTQEWAEVRRAVVAFLRDSEPVTLGGQVFCVWFFEGYLNLA